ncbi:SMP-30/gluconolactonase/LRE family protein [Pararcticibacter amylolyticus]|uniref:Uncharacterized protein n=1 Tax=Pararcticibacter amylolyticus TaxID=2173175 RepID=A0A2U2PI66_9SPHI|nr:hypothetical protein [Pararcticibacter amylolyticus]PWG81070.1 hypothetical protein DDR33_09090 [Pararcticibacter amylolyticus]
MKKYFLLLVLIVLTSFLNTKAANLSNFYVTPSTADFKISVSETSPKNVTAGFTIQRTYWSYGWEYLDWTVTLVLNEPSQETALSAPIHITHYDFNGATSLSKTLSATIPQGKLSGVVSLKYQYKVYNGSGTPTGVTNTEYSSRVYELTLPNQGNVDLNNANIFAVVGSELRRIDNNTGAYITVGGAVWPNTNVMTSLDGFLYIIQAGNIHRVNKSTGSYNIVTNNFPNSEGIAALDGELYIVQNNDLHRMNKDNGAYTVISSSWNGTEAMTALDGYIYIIQNGYLHKVNKNGSYSILGGQIWNGTNAMTNLDGYLYIVQNGYLHKVDKDSGTYSILGSQVWTGTSGAAAYNGSLYIVQNQRIHKVDKDTGSFAILGNPVWSGTAAVTSL